MAACTFIFSPLIIFTIDFASSVEMPWRTVTVCVVSLTLSLRRADFQTTRVDLARGEATAKNVEHLA